MSQISTPTKHKNGYPFTDTQKERIAEFLAAVREWKAAQAETAGPVKRTERPKAEPETIGRYSSIKA